TVELGARVCQRCLRAQARRDLPTGGNSVWTTPDPGGGEESGRKQRAPAGGGGDCAPAVQPAASQAAGQGGSRQGTRRRGKEGKTAQGPLSRREQGRQSEAAGGGETDRPRNRPLQLQWRERAPAGIRSRADARCLRSGAAKAAPQGLLRWRRVCGGPGD